MNKTTLIALACSLTFAAPLVAADSYTGFFLPPGQPLTGVIGGVTEIGAPCDPSSPLQGFDGYWFDVSNEPAGADFTLTVDPTIDADVWFYDVGCGFISDSSGAAGLLGESEFGALPAGTAWVIVDNFSGFGAFDLTIN